MRCPFPIAALALCIACDAQDSATTTEPCTVTIEDTWPMDGATDAYQRAAVEFTLSEPDATAVVFAAFEGEQSTRDDGLTVVYTPAAPLEPLTSYTVGLEYCFGEPEIEFTTSAYGLPLKDPDALAGSTWVYDLRDARFYQASHLGDLLQTFGERLGLIHIREVSEDNVAVRLAVATDDDPPTQDFCSRTVDIPEVDTSDSPYFQFGPAELSFDAYVGTITVHDMIVAGTLAADASSIGGLEVSATVDTRTVADAVEVDEEELCDLLELSGSPCEACPSDDEPWCVTTAADRFSAAAVDLQVEQILEADSDKRCEELKE